MYPKTQRIMEQPICVTLIAGTGQGKTTMVKSLIERKPCLVFDVQAEYSELSTDLNATRCRLTPSQGRNSHRDFMTVAGRKHGGTWCVFEEATGFLMGAQQSDMRAFLVAKRHPQEKGGRNILFVFHNIAAVPPFILAMSDYFVLFKTGDNPNEVKKKAPKLLPAFQQLTRMPKHSKLVIKNI